VQLNLLKHKKYNKSNKDTTAKICYPSFFERLHKQFNQASVLPVPNTYWAMGWVDFEQIVEVTY